MNNGPFGPTPGPYDPNQPQQQNPYGNAPLAPSSFGPGGGGGTPADDTMAWVSVGLSSVGWLSCCCTPIPILGAIGGLGGFALSIAGAICGYLAWQKAKQQSTRTDIAMVGMVLGLTRVALLLLFIVVAIVAVVALGGIAGIEEYTRTH